ncbi:MAG: hypothetical protein AAF557_01950 [Pseudomonadota bacterium]
MKASGMDRMRRVLSAMKMTEMARLGAQMRRVNAARQEAVDLRVAARGLTPVETVHDMALLDRWQRSLEQRARAAEARAELELAEAVPMTARLAETLGREDVTSRLIDQAKRLDMRTRDARAEDERVRPAHENQT